MWPMFLFGFLAIFVITQMHGVGLSRRTRVVLGTMYLVAVLGVYSWRGGLEPSVRGDLDPDHRIQPRRCDRCTGLDRAQDR